MDEFAKLVTDGGAAVAVIIVVVLFIRYISTRDEINIKQAQDFNKTIQSHMENEISAFNQMTSSMKEMQEYFQTLNGKLKKRKR